MADGRHSENHYISISQLQIVRIIRNLVCGHRFYPRRRKRDKKMRNNAIQDGGRMPYWKSFFGYNSTPSCPIKTKFRVRSHNRTHTKVRWWKCPISKMQHGGRPQFWKSLYLQISATNRPNCTKFSMHTQILPQATETTKKSEIGKFKMADGRRIENRFLAIIQLHVGQLRWTLEWGGRITRIQSRSGDYENPK